MDIQSIPWVEKYRPDTFENIILDMQTKYSGTKNLIDPEIDLQKQRLELLERNSLDKEKEDMWKD